MPRHIAFMRGINLGPNRRVAMSDLRRLLAARGHEDVRTHLQSGNVLLTSDLDPEALARRLESEIAEGLGVDAQVVARTREQLADVVARNPLADIADNPKRLQVSFLSGELDPAVAESLQDAATPSERFVVSGREIYAWHPDGIHSSELAKRLGDRRLGVAATARNWNTVTKLLELAGE